MNIPGELRYTPSHEWARQEAQEAVIGITEHAQGELRDVVFIELPQVGREVKAGETVAVIESVKAAFDIYAPVSGRISRVNDALARSPELVNQDCYGKGWLYAITPSVAGELKGLKSAEEYTKLIEAEAH